MTTLNANYINNLSTGNADGNVPISNGVLNVNLNAQYLNTLESTDFVRSNSDDSVTSLITFDRGTSGLAAIPFELNQYLLAVDEKLQTELNRESERSMTQAWLTINYLAMLWSDKHLPRLKDEIIRLRSGWDGLLSPASSAVAMNRFLKNNKVIEEE